MEFKEPVVTNFNPSIGEDPEACICLCICLCLCLCVSPCHSNCFACHSCFDGTEW